MKINCVLSGIPGYFKLRCKEDDLFKLTAENLKIALDYVDDKLGSDIQLTGLFNAYCEEVQARRANTIGCDFRTIFTDGIFADSGGLQMVTLGKGTVEKEDRMKIYETQSKYADFALSFDEIPSKMVEDIRYYLPEQVKSQGVKSGHNLKEQIEYFNSIESNIKVLPILQGWGVEDTKMFAEGLFKPLSKKQLDGLQCFATGFSAQGIHSSAMRIFDIYQVDILPKNAKKQLHLLGVTGFKRLIPMLQMIKNGFATGLETLSFDSTNLTMSYVMGGVIPSLESFKKRSPKIQLGKIVNDNVRGYYQEIFDFWKGCPNFDFESVDDLLEHSYYNSEGLTSGYQQYEFYLAENKLTDAVDNFSKVLKQEQYFILYNVYKYIMILEEYLNGHIRIDQIFKDKEIKFYEALEQITSNEEFEDWKEFVIKETGFKVNTLKGDGIVDTPSDITNCLF